jgi:hypothetical protein
MMGRRVEVSKKLLITVTSARHRGWTHFVTSEKSWLWLTIDYDQQWLSASADRSTRLRKITNAPKAMIVIFWSHFRFPVIQTLPEVRKQIEIRA